MADTTQLKCRRKEAGRPMTSEGHVDGLRNVGTKVGGQQSFGWWWMVPKKSCSKFRHRNYMERFVEGQAGVIC